MLLIIPAVSGYRSTLTGTKNSASELSESVSFSGFESGSSYDDVSRQHAMKEASDKYQSSSGMCSWYLERLRS